MTAQPTPAVVALDVVHAHADPLAGLEQATRLLAEARTLDDVLAIRDQAEAARLYARAISRGLEAQNHAASVKILAEHKAGEIIRDMELSRGTILGGRSVRQPTNGAPRLSDLGISRSQSSRWQATAAVPAPVLEEHIAETMRAGRELTSAGVLAIAKPLVRKQRPVKLRPTSASAGAARRPARITIMVDDARRGLARCEAESVQCAISSPPYYGLRSYDTLPQVWGGATACQHKWNDASFCCVCAAWFGELGQEPTPQLYVEHIVAIMRGVWRVLRKDGCVWLNIGDGSARSGKGPTGWNGTGDQVKRQGFGGRGESHSKPKLADVPAKSLLLIPERIGLALMADGWTVRRRIPWFKRTEMPESVDDRTSGGIEYVFLLNKSTKVYWDASAVRRPSAGQDSDGRNLRTSDFFFETWQGLLLDAEDLPMALVVNTVPGPGEHSATFPRGLIEPMIRASSRPGDLVLDCVAGAGTVGVEAAAQGRDALLIELNPEYAQQSRERILADGYTADVHLEQDDGNS
jgi:site-specific DNA-methyltransferase (cytosine-N4-specific)